MRCELSLAALPYGCHGLPANLISCPAGFQGVMAHRFERSLEVVVKAVDLNFPKYKLCVECDVGLHELHGNQENDVKRQIWLTLHYQVTGIWCDIILQKCHAWESYMVDGISPYTYLSATHHMVQVFIFKLLKT